MPARTEKNAAPRELPPASLSNVGQAGPVIAIDEISVETAINTFGAPTIMPPAEALRTTDGDQAITAWHNAVKVNGLWVNAAARNAWASLTGLGWRRVVFANDSAFLNITALLSHARQMNASCNIRIEADNLIHEVYVW